MSKPSGYSWLSPYIIVNDVAAALKFYQTVFGFNIKESTPGQDGALTHAELTYQGQTIMFGKANPASQSGKPPIATKVKSPISLYVYCEDVDKFYKDAVAAGAKSLLMPEDTFWGDRMCSLEDPDGYIWNFATHTGKIDLAVAQM